MNLDEMLRVNRCRDMNELINLPPTKEEVNAFAAFVCLSVSKITQKRVHEFG